MNTEPFPGRPANLRETAGFTLAETLVAIVIAGIVMIAIYQVMVTTQRVSTVQREQVILQGTLRAGLDVLAQELREASTAAGGVSTADGDRVGFQALRTFGVVCAKQAATDAILTVQTFGRPFTSGSQAFVFADGDQETALDDTWLTGTVGGGGTAEECGSDRVTQTVVIGGSLPSVHVGAIVREFETVEYHLQEVDGQVFLARTQGGSTARLVGPLDPDDGLEFTYFDQDGNTTGTPANVRQVRITLRAASDARWAAGQDALAGALTTSVVLRN